MKQKRAILIDNNQTVQALAQLALEQVGISVEMVVDPSEALPLAQKIKPDLVICNRDVKGIDPFIVCEQLKLAAPNLKFILLASGQSASAIAREAQGSGIDEVLLKPFKSEQLKSAAQRLLGGAAAATATLAEKPLLYIFVSDPFYHRVLELFFENRRVDIKFIGNADIAEGKLSFVNQSAILDSAAALANSAQTSQLRECSIIADFESIAEMRAQFPAAAILPRPLTCEALVVRFNKIYPEKPKDKLPPPLSPTEQAVLCAKISASVYERLLSSRALRERNWDEAGDSAVEELVRICKKFDLVTRS